MLIHATTFPLRYSQDCVFLGITPEQHLFLEEYSGEAYYGVDLEFVAQTHYDATGNVLATADEADGVHPFMPLALPIDLVKPRHNPPKHPLNYTGARRRGLREPDRLLDWVQPLSVIEKMTVIDVLKLSLLPAQLAGIAESRVLAEAAINAEVSVVCRLVRLALMLPKIGYDSAGLPYDYDTVPLYLAHLLNSNDEMPSLNNSFHDFYGVRLHRPQDCLVYNHTLWIADGGDPTLGRRSQVHAWQIQR